MKGQFFIMATVIMIYALMTMTNYIYDFSSINLVQLKKMPQLFYVQDIRNALDQTVKSSKQSLDCNKLENDISATENFLKNEMISRGVVLTISHNIDCSSLTASFDIGLKAPEFYISSGKTNYFDGVLWLKFDENTGNTAYDSSKYKNDGTLQNIYPLDVIAGNPSLEAPWSLKDNTDANHRIEIPYKWDVGYNYINSSKMLALQENNIVKDGNSSIRMSITTAPSCMGTIQISDCDNMFPIDETKYLEGGNFYHVIKGTTNYGDKTFKFYNSTGGYLSRRWATGYAPLLTDLGDGWYIQSYIWQPSSGDPNQPTDEGDIPYIPKGAKYACMMQFFDYQSWNIDKEAIFDKFFVYQWDSTPTDDQRISRASSGWTNGKYGKALRFDGINDYVEVPYSTNLNSLNNSFTLEAWIKPYIANHEGFNRIIWFNGNKIDFAFTNQVNGVVAIWLKFNDSTYSNWLTGSTPLTLGQWYHVAATFSVNSGNVDIYVNGKNDGEFNVGQKSITALSDNIDIGNVNDLSRGFNGIIDEVKVWNRALTATEIQSEYAVAQSKCSDGTPYGSCSATKPLYCSSGTPISSCSQCGCPSGQACQPDGTCTNFVASWSFNESSGITAFDSSSFHNDGTFYGETFNDGTFYGETFNDGTSYSGTTLTDLHTSSGKYGKALQFDGSSNYVSLPAMLPSNNVFTVGLWFKTSSYGTLISEQNNQYPNVPVNWDPFLYVENNGKLHGGICCNVPNLESSSTVNDNNWHYATLVVNGNVQSLYLDGSFVNSFNGNPEGPYNYLYLGTGYAAGSWPNTNGDWFFFNGLIDEVRIWNRTLSLAEINADMQSSLPTSRTIASYSFEESGNYVNDTHIWVNGTYGSALSFDGINDYVNAGNPSSLQLIGDMTIMFWTYPTNVAGSRENPIDKAYCGEFALTQEADGSLSFYQGPNGGETGGYMGRGWGSVFVNNQWVHVAIVRNVSAQSIRLYINGTDQGEGGSSWANPSVSGEPVTIGGGYAGPGYQGIIDEVRIYNRSLSLAEINADMQSSLPMSRPVASYRFEEKSGNYVNDTHIWVNGISGSALSFDSINDYVSVNNVPVNTSLGANTTVTFWMYWKGNNEQMPFSWLGQNYDLYLSGGYFGFNTYNGDVWGISSVGLSNRWVHVAAIFYNGNDNVSRLFINGTEQVLSQTGTVWSRSVSNFPMIGRGVSSDYFFGGIIDEVKVWNRALTATEIQSEYCSSGTLISSCSQCGCPSGQACQPDGTCTLIIVPSAPQYWLNFVNNTVAGQSALFSLNWTDDVGLSGYIFSTNNSGTWQNDSFAFNTTFGKTDIGASTDGWGPNREALSKFTLNDRASVQSITAYIQVNTGGHITYAVYSVSGSAPGNLLGKTQEINPVSGGGWAWQTASFVSPITLSPGDYYLLVGSDIAFQIKYDTLAGDGYGDGFGDHTYPNYPQIWSGGAADDKRRSIYATYMPTQAWSNVTKTLNSTIGSIVAWCVYANDTSNNWNYTSCINPFALTTTSGSVLNLHFNEANSTKVYDSSGYGNDGTFYGETFNDGTYYGETFNNGTSYSGAAPADLHTPSGKYGKALQFDGANDYVDAGNKSTLIPTNQMTIEAWIKFDQSALSHGQSMMILAKRHSVSPWYSYFLHVYDDSGTNEILFEYVNGAGQPTNTGTNINLNINTWYYVTAVLNATGYPRIYINGIDRTDWGGQQLVGNLYQSDYSLLIGADYSGYKEFNGTIDEVRIYNRSLSQAEINADMQSSMPMSRTIASYSFEEPASATYVNDTHTRVNGTYGSALSFDGVNDYVSLPDSSNLNITSNRITLSAWVNFNSFSLPTNSQIIIIKSDSGATAQLDYGLRLQGGALKFVLGNGSMTSELDASLTALPSVGVWHYLTGTFNGTHALIYLDGNLNSSNSLSGFNTIRTSTGASGSPPTIGNFPQYSQYFNGTIDEVRIWNRALSQAEIQAEMQSSLPVSRPVASYRFEESGNYVNDTHIWVNGTYGSALSFDGASDFVNVSNSASLNPKSITLGAWIKPRPTLYTQGIVVKGADVYDILIDSATGKLGFAFRDASHTGQGLWANSIIVSWNVWQYVATAYNGTHVTFYLNQSNETDSLNYGDIYTLDTEPLFIGASSYWVTYGGTPDNTIYFNGTIDEVRIWNRSLSQAEIQTEMSKG